MTAHQLLRRDGFARAMGIRLVSEGDGGLTVEMDIRSEHRDGGGRVASGVIFSLADCAMSLASNASRREVAVATHLTRGEAEAGATTLRAELSTSNSRGSRTTTWQVVVRADGQAVAAFTGTTLAVGRPQGS